MKVVADGAVAHVVANPSELLPEESHDLTGAAPHQAPAVDRARPRSAPRPGEKTWGGVR